MILGLKGLPSLYLTTGTFFFSSLFRLLRLLRHNGAPDFLSFPSIHTAKRAFYIIELSSVQHTVVGVDGFIQERKKSKKQRFSAWFPKVRGVMVSWVGGF